MTQKPPEIERPPFWEVEDEDHFQGHGKPMEVDTVMLVYNLENDVLYTATEAVATRYPRNHTLYKSVFHRLCTFLSASWLTQRPDKTEPKCKKESRSKSTKPAKQGKSRSVDRSLVRRWYGATLKNQLSDKNYYRAQILSTLPGLLQQITNAKDIEEREKLKASLQVVEKRDADRFGPTAVKGKPLAIGLPRRRRTGTWLVLVAAVCVLFFSAITTALVKSSERVYEVLRTQGAKKAWDYVVSNQERGIAVYYQSAWIDYRSNRFESAEQKAYVILSDKETPVKVQADCYYLLGEIKAVTGGSRESIGSLLDAYRLYEQEERDANLYHCSLVMAKAYTGLTKFDEAKGMLDQALMHYQGDREDKIQHLGKYYLERVRLGLRTGDFQDALQATLEGAKIYEETGDKDNLAGAYSSLGFLYAVTGNRELGWAYTVRAQDLIFALEDNRRRVYNLVNFVLLQRLSGLEPEENTLRDIQRWIDKYADKELRFHLGLAQNYESEAVNQSQLQN